MGNVLCMSLPLDARCRMDERASEFLTTLHLAGRTPRSLVGARSQNVNPSQPRSTVPLLFARWTVVQLATEVSVPPGLCLISLVEFWGYCLCVCGLGFPAGLGE